MHLTGEAVCYGQKSEDPQQDNWGDSGKNRHGAEGKDGNN